MLKQAPCGLPQDRLHTVHVRRMFDALPPWIPGALPAVPCRAGIRFFLSSERNGMLLAANPG